MAIGGCGGGDDSTALTVTIDGPAIVEFDGPAIVLSGTASLPEGSYVTGGTPSVPWVTCQTGPYTLTWSNAATGQSGNLTAFWNCTESFLRWSTIPLPLALGANPVTVSMIDERSSANDSDSVTVNRR
ncbi:hypothetical protein [Zeimonas arvi]|uniref:Uncharacterized protein n=1 Tax=Zeimonas arvi TaxID=2498847 RepID=A0A5C8P0R4_9BURK|nr:hypothetical protein [Zeimonas arvi]TXL66898.1 hypothetical protein FHP08_04525 [Zeimonas arvi]